MINRYDDLKNFFISRPVSELLQFECYIDYKSLFRDILVSENQENLPKPLDEINAYREKVHNDERTFMKMGFDAENLGVDLKEYFDYDVYTKEFINIYEIEDKDVGYLINEGVGADLFEELNELVQHIPQLNITPTKERNKKEDDYEYDDYEDDFDDYDFDDER